MSIPFNEEELTTILKNAHEFAQSCFGFDSLGRGMAWSQLALSIGAVIKEERLHNFEFPSPNNPFKEKI